MTEEAQHKQTQFKGREFKDLQISKQQGSLKKRWPNLRGAHFLFARSWRKKKHNSQFIVIFQFERNLHFV